MRILLVEDDRALSLGIRHALEHEGWRVDLLADGEQAMNQGWYAHKNIKEGSKLGGELFGSRR